MEIKIKNTSSNPLPKYETNGAAGMDIFAAHDAVLESLSETERGNGGFGSTGK